MTRDLRGQSGDLDLVLPLGEVSQSLVLEDVSSKPAALAWAFDLVVQGYLSLSSQTLDPQAVREEVCLDAYHRHGLVRTLVLTGLHPETGEREPLGTMRVTTGAAQAPLFGLPPLETMELMAPAQGWDAYDFAGFDPMLVAEGGRLAVSATCRTGRSRDIGLSALVLRALVTGVFQYAAAHHGKTQLWGVLPYYVIERLEALGMTVIPAVGVVYRSAGNAQMFDRYDRYWRHGRPTFCRVLTNS
jgi:hypothetical protein